MGNSIKISCRNVWKVFGPDPKATLKKIETGLSRQDIQKETGHVVAVSDVTFDIEEGKTFVIMGLSGSGKSTLIRCMTRLIDPTAGQILIDGEDITRLSSKALMDFRRYRMSMVFQHFGLLPHRTVKQNVEYGLDIRGEPRNSRDATVSKAIEVVGLDGWEDHYPRQLSGGMQQRVGLARALAVDPEILMFDEPFSALDPLIRRDMQDELIQLQDQLNKTMVFITHDFLEAIKLGDVIAIMKDGVVEQIGTSSEIVLRPVNEYVRRFVEDVPKTQVLTLGDIAQTGQPGADGPSLSAKTKLEDALVHFGQGATGIHVLGDGNTAPRVLTARRMFEVISSQNE